jgi:hypothetical protein
MQDLLPSTPGEYLSLGPSTQSQVDNFSDGVIHDVKYGNEDPLKVLVSLKAFDKASERIQKEIRENCLTAADKYPGASFEFVGNKIEKSEMGVKYDYAGTGDPVYQKLFAIAEQANAQLKERETFLKAVTAPFSFLDEATGEVSVISPPNKKSTTGLKVSIR